MNKKEFYVQSKNTRLFVRLSGNFESDRIIVTLHGGPGSGCKPLYTNKSFIDLEKNNLVVYFDQRGCGNSQFDLKEKIILDDLCDDVHSIISTIKELFNNKEIYLLGCSFGGALGFFYLRKYPNEINRYISSSPALYFSEEDLQNGFSLLIESYKNRIPINLFTLISNIRKPSINEINNIFSNIHVVNFINSETCKSNSLKYILAMSPWYFNESFGNDFINLKIPTLILHGTNDDMFNIETLKKGLFAFSNNLITFKEFFNCGHALFEDNEIQFVNNIENFINKEEY